MKDIVKNIKKDLIKENEKLMYISIFILLVGFMINGCLFTISSKISTTFCNIMDIALLIIEGGIIGITILSIFLKNTKKTIIIYLTFILVFATYFIIFENNRSLISNSFMKFFIYNVTAFILFYFIEKYEKLEKKIIQYSKILLLFSIIYTLLISKEEIYNIWISQHFFIVSIFMIYDFIKYKTKSSILLNLISLAGVLYTGSRTYLLISLITTILGITTLILNKIKKENNIRKKTIIIIILVIIAVIGLSVIINYKNISKELYDYFLNEYKTEIRILKLINSNNFFLANSRTEYIYPIVLNIIKENPITGVGIYGDRVHIYSEMSKLDMIKDGYGSNAYYSHNLILEIYVSFGIILGSIIIAFITYKYYKIIKTQENKKGILICLTIIAIAPLVLNGSFLDSIFFWALIGVLLSANNTQNEENTNKKNKTIYMILTNGFDPDIRVYKEARYLVENGFLVKILCWDRKCEYKEKIEDNLDGIEIKRFNILSQPGSGMKQLGAYIKFIISIRKYLKDKEYTYLHCHDFDGVLTGFATRKNNTQKLIFDMHEIYKNYAYAKNVFFDIIFRYILEKSDYIIYVNEEQIEGIKNKYENKLIYLPNYPENEYYNPIKKNKSQKTRINYVGVLRDYQSLKALAAIGEKHTQFEIGLYGTGICYEQLKNEYKDKSIKLYGKYNGIDESGEIYRNTDILYCSYDPNVKNWKNAYPVKLFESIITETPIIVTQNTRVGEFVSEKGIGQEVKYADEDSILKAIYEINKNYNDYVENIKKISYKYDWKEAVKELKKIYIK